ncbi:MAG TPA: hypothetical protein VIJ60_12950 [Acidimicrobiales bacterium]|jgi:hypothetical protein
MAGLELGTRYYNDPIPPVPEDTTYYPVSALSIGVEYRHLDDAVVNEVFNTATLQKSIAEGRPDVIEDEGVSLHVCDGETGTEYLRFDVFVKEPHYHYIVPGEYNVVIPFDPAASGAMFEWAIGCIRERLEPMLANCGASELWQRVDPAALEQELPTVIDAANLAVAAS